MPKRKIIKKDIHDKFYTKPEIAEICIERLKPFLTEDTILIEPSAGNGSFSKQIKCIALDIEPEDSSIIKEDYLQYALPWGRVCVFGNPPFGERNKLSKLFIRHSLSANIIAFILPAVFEKETYQKVFPSNWHLADKWELPNYSFILHKTNYHVPCVFQIWVKNWRGFDLRVKNLGKIETHDFAIVTKHDDSDLFVFGAAPTKYIEPDAVTPNNRGYYIKATGASICEIKKYLSTIDWKKYGKSSVNGGAFWLTKTEFLIAYESGKDELHKTLPEYDN